MKKHVVSSIDGMVAMLVNLVSKGYRYYFVGQVKEGKALEDFDGRLVAHYEADLPKWGRERRKRVGVANFRYLRFERWFIVLATEGSAARFWQEDRERIRDVRHTPIRFHGYSLSYRQGGYKDRALWKDPLVRERDMKWHARVQLDAETYAGIKAYFLNIAIHRQADILAREFLSLPFQPYRPVREQLFSILRAVNGARQLAGYQRIPASVIRYKRRIVRIFESHSDIGVALDENNGRIAGTRGTNGIWPSAQRLFTRMECSNTARP
jgi:hypothetical protein